MFSKVTHDFIIPTNLQAIMYSHPSRDPNPIDPRVNPSAWGMEKPDQSLFVGSGQAMPPPVPPRTYNKHTTQAGILLTGFPLLKF